jgi:cytochrome c biogenesis factor
VELATIGHGVLAMGCVAVVAGVVSGSRRVLVAAAGLAATATAVLAWGFVTSNFSLRSVAEHSRRTVGAPYRLSGLWAGTAPSLLFWSTIALALAALTAGTARVVRACAAIAGSFFVIGALAADPFERLALPPIDGGGLSPILEHPAMLIHPPLLYLGALLTLPAFVLAATAASRPDAIATARRWLIASAAVLTVALALGAWWSYAEQGWGGYWAWDPVENGGLLPWLAAVAAVHVSSSGSARLRVGTAMAPFTLAVAGTWLTRSGAAQSVHAFAEARVVGWGIGALSAAIIVWAIVAIARTPNQRGDGSRLSRLSRVQIVLAAEVAVIVSIGTFAPVIFRSLGHPASISGSFFARLLVLSAVVAMAGSMLAIAGRHRRSRAQLIAHIGFLLMLSGVAGSVVHRTERIILSPGQSRTVLGRNVRYLGSFEPTNTRADTEPGFADLRIDGTTMRPGLVRFTATDQVLVETATSRRWWGDVQAVLVARLPSDVATFDIRVWPFQSLVWIGSLVMAFGLVGAGVRRRVSVSTTPATSPLPPQEAATLLPS